MHADVAIIGAGILGLSLGQHLAGEGCSSIILERESAAGIHASGKNAGMFRQLYRDRQLTNWASRSPDLWPAEIRDAFFRRTGSYVVGRNLPEHHEELFEARRVRMADGKEIDAVYCSTDGLIESAKFLPALAAALPQKLCRVGFDTTMISAEWKNERWHIATASAELECARLVVCNGAWAAKAEIADGSRRIAFAPGTIQPYARYLFVVDGWPKDFMPEPDCGFYWNEVDEWYMRRWTSDARLFSLCDQFAADPENFEPAENFSERLREHLRGAFPQFHSSLTLTRSWHCFRTYTPDQKPIWGPDPRQDGLFWLAGFGGFGMSTGFAASYDLARLICGKPVKVDSSVIIERLLTTN